MKKTFDKSFPKKGCNRLNKKARKFISFFFIERCALDHSFLKIWKLFSKLVIWHTFKLITNWSPIDHFRNPLKWNTAILLSRWVFFYTDSFNNKISHLLLFIWPKLTVSFFLYHEQCIYPVTMYTVYIPTFCK